MKMSAEIGSLATALAKAQKEFTAPKKSHTAKVGAYSYKYSTLDELLAATQPYLIENGIATVQNTSSPDGGTVGVATTLLHTSGQWLEFDPVVMPVGTTPQSVGAAITYARRYSLGAALNVAAEEDDDAQSVKRPVNMPPPVEIQPSPAKLAAEVNAAVKAGHDSALKPASSLKAPVRKTQSRYVPPMPPNGEQLPPLTDDDIPF